MSEVDCRCLFFTASETYLSDKHLATFELLVGQLADGLLRLFWRAVLDDAASVKARGCED